MKAEPTVQVATQGIRSIGDCTSPLGEQQANARKQMSTRGIGTPLCYPSLAIRTVAGTEERKQRRHVGK